MAKTPYSKRALFRTGPQPWLTGRQLDCVAFPLGGLGTGCISLGGWGQLRDWEIRNRPAKGSAPPNVFFTLRTQVGRSDPVVRVLQGPCGGAWAGDGHSAPHGLGEGLPHFRNAAFKGEFPVAQVRLDDGDVPLEVRLEAFNPFIPLNARESGIPVACLVYHFTNRSRRKVAAWVFGNHTNIVQPPETAVNEARSAAGLTGLFASNTGLPAGLPTAQQAGSPQFGSTALCTPAPGASVWPRWPGGRSTLVKFWEAVAESDAFPPTIDGSGLTGTVGVPFTVKGGETVAIAFFITWHFPVCEYWSRPKAEPGAEAPPAPTWRNWYATQWTDAWNVAEHVHGNFARLYDETVRFRDALFSSTLPAYVLDAVSSQISTLKTPAVLRLEDGTFYGFEGCSNTAGCCQGSCTHVWNYAQALPWLFPDLQRSMREADYAHAMRDDGFIQFRLPLPLGAAPDFQFHPAADGQMGGVLQVYREWLISGDTDWLRRMWPRTRKALEFAWTYWDADRDGVMEGMQHNTYDIEFYGPNTMMGSLYLGALRAAEEMAKALGETDKAAEYRALFDKGSAWTDANLFNGEYFEQRVEPQAHAAWPEPYRSLAEKHGRDDRFPWPAWQFGKGCPSDQLLGQWYGAMLDLGHFYNPRHVRKALASIFKHNWRSDLGDHPGFLRLYALNDEAGLLVCTWPRGERPGQAFYFADEVWTGMEYQAASHMIYEGLVEEGLSIVLGARRRYDGSRRNPWDEIECGHHYVRAMAAYALLTALSGFRYSAPEQSIGFDPRIHPRRFRGFYSVGSGWGVYRQRIKGRRAEVTLDVLYGRLVVRRIDLRLEGVKNRRVAARLDGEPLDASVSAPAGEAGRVAVSFDPPVEIAQGRQLCLTLR